MQLSTSEISELIKTRIKDFSTSSEARTQGNSSFSNRWYCSYSRAYLM